MQPTELTEAILQLVSRPQYRPAKPRVIAQRLGLPKAEVASAKKIIKKLIATGQLRYGANHLIQPAAAGETAGEPVRAGKQRGKRIVGPFRRNEAGFGFVRPRGVTRGEEGREADIYIPAKRTKDAANGDIVAVQLLPPGHKHPGPRGEIVEVIERETNQFVGTYYEQSGYGLVQIDGTLFTRPIHVGDPGAAGVAPDDKVVVEMIHFPSPIRAGEGVITQVLGPRGKPGVDTLAIIHEFGLPGEFAEDALQEARDRVASFDEDNLEDRYDATGETVLTIDPIDARDFDDAISLEKLENGHWRLGVHIADVSHFVQPNSPLDREAQERATSVYLPDRVIPMLPELISNGVASLQPNKVRYTKTVYIEFTADGVRTHVEAHRAAIKSSKRLAYEQVDGYMADPKAWLRKLGKPVHALLGRMYELAMILRRRRFEHGALAMDMPEVKIDLDRQGKVVGAHAVVNTESHQIIEEFMLAANEAVAELLAAKEIPFLRRVHESPIPRKLKALTEFVNELGFETASLESRFEIQSLLEKVAGHPQEQAVHYALLRAMQRAVYSPEPLGHFALASDCYCHFTSPIRRYPDLTVHRLLDAVIRGVPPVSDFNALLTQGEHCSQREERAEKSERELIKVKLLTYLQNRVGEEMNAVITGVESFGLFAQGIELPAEGFIHINSLADDYYQFDRTSHTLSGFRSGNRYQLGDVLRVAVARVDIDRRQLDFKVVARPAAAAKRPAADKGKPPKQKGTRKAVSARRKPAEKPAKKKTVRRKKR
ncbi:MAG: ribonuclease R [Planctomycetaceae bacterium]|nr:ribonuclease R [Planctomycetaceae bacterium]